MKKEMLEYYLELEELSIIKRRHATKEEIDAWESIPVNELPPGVFKQKTTYVTGGFERVDKQPTEHVNSDFVVFPVLSDEIISNKIALTNARNVSKIKKYVLFFVIITIISLAIALLSQLIVCATACV